MHVLERRVHRARGPLRDGGAQRLVAERAAGRGLRLQARERYRVLDVWRDGCVWKCRVECSIHRARQVVHVASLRRARASTRSPPGRDGYGAAEGVVHHARGRVVGGLSRLTRSNPPRTGPWRVRRAEVNKPSTQRTAPHAGPTPPSMPTVYAIPAAAPARRRGRRTGASSGEGGAGQSRSPADRRRSDVAERVGEPAAVPAARARWSVRSASAMAGRVGPASRSAASSARVSCRGSPQTSVASSRARRSAAAARASASRAADIAAEPPRSRAPPLRPRAVRRSSPAHRRWPLRSPTPSERRSPLFARRRRPNAVRRLHSTLAVGRGPCAGRRRLIAVRRAVRFRPLAVGRFARRRCRRQQPLSRLRAGLGVRGAGLSGHRRTARLARVRDASCEAGRTPAARGHPRPRHTSTCDGRDPLGHDARAHAPPGRGAHGRRHGGHARAGVVEQVLGARRTTLGAP